MGNTKNTHRASNISVSDILQEKQTLLAFSYMMKESLNIPKVFSQEKQTETTTTSIDSYTSSPVKART